MTPPQIEIDGNGDFVARITHDLGRLENPERGRSRRIAMQIGDHAIVDFFDPHGIRDDLHNIFSAADWSHITVCRVGYSMQETEDCPATILIGVRHNTMTTDEAVTLLTLAAQSVYRFPELHDVAIEIIEADVVSHGNELSRLGVEREGDAYEFDDAFCDKPQLGAAVGLSDSTDSIGSLGGYLRVGTAPYFKYMALTCHHVLATDKAAIQPANNSPGHLAVTCPPQHDVHAWKAGIEKRIRQTARIIAHKLLEGQTKRSRKEPKRHEDILHLYQTGYQKVLNFRNELARVYCTSEAGSSKDHWIIDWGLAELAPGRVQSYNDLSSALQLDAIDKFWRKDSDASYLVSSFGGGIASLDELTPKAPSLDGVETAVFKCGRSTGKTRGQLTSTPSSIRMRYPTENRGEVTVEGKALAVLAPPKHTRPFRLVSGPVAPFGHRGDSGSLVFNYKGKAIGIYIGAQREWEVHADPPAVGSIHFVSPIVPNLDSMRAAVQNDPSFAGAEVSVEFLWGDGSHPWF